MPDANIMKAANAPSVGIFWRVADILVIDRSTLDEAEPYGDCITHAQATMNAGKNGRP